MNEDFSKAKETLAERLFLLREEANIPRQKAADELGINRNTLEYYEKGKRTPDVGMIARLAKYYGVTADYLFGFSEFHTPENEKLVTELHLSEKAVEFLKIHDNLLIVNAMLSCDPKLLSDLVRQITYYLNAAETAQYIVKLASFSEKEKEELLTMWRSAIMNKIDTNIETILNEINSDSDLMAQLPSIGYYPVPINFALFKNGDVHFEVNDNEE